MSLKLAGSLATIERIDTVVYSPGLQNSSDLEAATKTITATAEPAVDDYSSSLTLPASPDLRLVVKRIAARLAVTIDSIPAGDTNLFCRVYVDTVAAANRLFDMSWTAAGAQLAVVDTHAGNLATTFNLLKDGAAHTFKFRFWKAGTGTGPVISVVQLWEGIGTFDANPQIGLSLTHSGFVQIVIAHTRVGTGTAGMNISNGGYVWSRRFWRPAVGWDSGHFLIQDADFHQDGTVATDLNYVDWVVLTLRSGT